MVVSVRKYHELGVKRVSVKIEAKIRTRLKPTGKMIVSTDLFLGPVKTKYILSGTVGLHSSPFAMMSYGVIPS
jgi:hypothetical protein